MQSFKYNQILDIYFLCENTMKYGNNVEMELFWFSIWDARLLSPNLFLYDQKWLIYHSAVLWAPALQSAGPGRQRVPVLWSQHTNGYNDAMVTLVTLVTMVTTEYQYNPLHYDKFLVAHAGSSGNLPYRPVQWRNKDVGTNVFQSLDISVGNILFNAPWSLSWLY